MAKFVTKISSITWGPKMTNIAGWSIHLAELMPVPIAQSTVPMFASGPIPVKQEVAMRLVDLSQLESCWVTLVVGGLSVTYAEL